MDLLDRAHERINDGDVFDGMEELLGSLSELRAGMDRPAWRDWCATEVRAHPIFEDVHQAPFTRRAFEKPRGYAGDAVTLDFIFGFEALPDTASPLARQLWPWELQRPSCRSVRARRDLLTTYIDDACGRVARPRVVSLACGHLREAHLAHAVLDRRLGALFAIDHDPENLAVVEQELSPFGVAPVRGSLRGVLSRKIRYDDIDLAYAAGLYDYLGPAVAAQLTHRLFDMLRSGGQLLIPNYSSALPDIAYLEAFMDWQLLYREEDELASVASRLPADEVASVRVFREKHGNICMLEITRR